MKHIIQIANPRGTIFQSIIRNDEQCLELDASFTKVINHGKEQTDFGGKRQQHYIDCNLILLYGLIHILTNDRRSSLVISNVSASALLQAW